MGDYLNVLPILLGLVCVAAALIQAKPTKQDKEELSEIGLDSGTRIRRILFPLRRRARYLLDYRECVANHRRVIRSQDEFLSSWKMLPVFSLVRFRIA